MAHTVNGPMMAALVENYRTAADIWAQCQQEYTRTCQVAEAARGKPQYRAARKAHGATRAPLTRADKAMARAETALLAAVAGDVHALQIQLAALTSLEFVTGYTGGAVEEYVRALQKGAEAITGVPMPLTWKEAAAASQEAQRAA